MKESDTARLFGYLTIVWKTLEEDLPELQAQTRVVIEAERLDSESDSSD